MGKTTMKDDHYDLMSPWIVNPEGHEESVPIDSMAKGRWNYYGTGEEQPLPPVKADPVFRPNHYAQFWPEPVTVINAWNLNFNKGNAVKYIARAGHKDAEEQDLRKAIRYLEIEIECLRRRKAKGESKEIWGETL
jgi:hypothetical protein